MGLCRPALREEYEEQAVAFDNRALVYKDLKGEPSWVGCRPAGEV
jgi:hypothetical protein